MVDGLHWEWLLNLKVTQPPIGLTILLKSQYCGGQLEKVFVYKIQVNPIHTILKYGDYYDFIDR